MKLCIKKIYCSSCRRLVKGREQQMENRDIQVLCSRCGRLLYVWNGVTWRYIPEGA